MKFKFFRKIHDGEAAPNFYGFICYDFASRGAIACPIPFNIIFGLVVALWRNLRWFYIGTCQSRRDAYYQGRRDEKNDILKKGKPDHE